MLRETGEDTISVPGTVVSVLKREMRLRGAIGTFTGYTPGTVRTMISVRSHVLSFRCLVVKLIGGGTIPTGHFFNIHS